MTLCFIGFPESRFPPRFLFDMFGELFGMLVAGWGGCWRVFWAHVWRNSVESGGATKNFTITVEQLVEKHGNL